MQPGGGDYDPEGAGEEPEDDGALNYNNNNDNDEIISNPVEDFEDELEIDDEFRPHWSDQDPASNNNYRQAKPLQQQLSPGCVSLTYPLLPNCLALVFKQTNCAFHSIVDSNCCRVCASRLVGICPNCGPASASKPWLQHQNQHLNAAADSDLGFRLFKSFRDTNRKYLFWHRDLARCLRRLEYVGFIQPFTVLATSAGGEDWLDVLKRCWSQQLLVSPPSYSLEMLAEVQGCQMQSVCQSAAVNLIDAICGVICDLAFTSLPSTLDVIFAAVVNKYSGCGADIPPIAVFNDMLAFLVSKRRVILTPNGCYRMASKESFAHHNHHSRGHKSRHHRHHLSTGQQVQTGGPENQQNNVTQVVHLLEPGNKDGGDQHVSIFRRLFKRRFFGRAKSRDSTPPPQSGFILPEQPSSSSPPPLSSRSTNQAPVSNNRHPSPSPVSPPVHSMPGVNNNNNNNNLLPYRGAGAHLTRQPGLFDCYTTGAVPSVSTNGESVTRSRHGHQYRNHPLRRWPQKTQPPPDASTTTSASNTGNGRDESGGGTSAPFSTPTSAYLSSSAVIVNVDHQQQQIGLCDEGYEGGLASGCAPVIIENQAGMTGERIELQSMTSSPSSSSWTSSGGGGANNNNNNSKNCESDNNIHINSEITKKPENNNEQVSGLTASCAKIVSAEIDSLIERYRNIGGQTAAVGGGNLAECTSRASTGTLFSVGDYMVYSAGLMVDEPSPSGDDNKVIESSVLPPAVGKLISAPTVEECLADGDDNGIAMVRTVITIEDDGEEVVNNTMAAQNNGEMMLKIDAGQAIFGA